VNRRIEIKRYILYFLSSFIPILFLFTIGKEINEGQSISILLERGVLLTDGIINWQGSYEISSFLKFNRINYLKYIISFVIGIIHFFFFIYLLKKQYIKQFALIFTLALIYSLPLFGVATDWGRWIHIHFVFLLLLLTLILPKKGESVLINKKTDYLYLLLIIPMLLWRMNHFLLGFAFHSYLSNKFISLIHKIIL